MLRPAKIFPTWLRFPQEPQEQKLNSLRQYRKCSVALGLTAAGLLGLLSGCGAEYRPVVTPLNPTGPGQQDNNGNFVVLSTDSSATTGLATLINGLGDTIMAQATLGNGVFSFALNSTGSTGYSLNSNGDTNVTMDAYPTTAPSSLATSFGLQTSHVTNSTLTPGSNPTAIFVGTNDVYLLEPYSTLSPTAPGAANAALAVLTLQAAPTTAGQVATAPALQQEISIAPNPVQFAGTPSSSRVYAISQGQSVATSGTGAPVALAMSACNTPSAVTTPGEVASLETNVNTVDTHIPVGICPVFGIMSGDNNRAFILNRGSNDVTVINVQQNAIDTGFNINGAPANGIIPVGAGPVHAALYQPAGLLVTANYDSGTITVINVGLDIFGNDAANFGQTHTIPVGKGPVAVTVLQDGSRAYVANQLDGTVSVVNLTSFTVTSTIPVYGGGHPDAIASISAIGTGTVFVLAKDSQYVTAIRTDTDQVSANIFLQSYGMAVQATTQTAGGSSNSPPGGRNNQFNSIVASRPGGQGVPCNPVRDPSPYCAVPTP
jgi:YVTN family beta-propeller protein